MAAPPPAGVYVPVPTFFVSKTAANYNPVLPLSISLLRQPTLSTLQDLASEGLSFWAARERPSTSLTKNGLKSYLMCGLPGLSHYRGNRCSKYRGGGRPAEERLGRRLPMGPLPCPWIFCRREHARWHHPVVESRGGPESYS